MSEGSFQSLDLNAARVGLERLFEQVIRGTGRIEITRNGSDESCVLISQAELKSLERALEILSSTDSAAEMRQQVLRLADALAPRQPAVAASGAA
jgi:PHD/YefM family antitoxin component YafN of YafNO toxin-antitoxin module